MSNGEEAKVAREKLDTWLELLTHNNLPMTGLLFFFLGGGVVNTIGKQGCKKHLVLLKSMSTVVVGMYFILWFQDVLIGRGHLDDAHRWFGVLFLVFDILFWYTIYIIYVLLSALCIKVPGVCWNIFWRLFAINFLFPFGKALRLQSTCMFLEMQILCQSTVCPCSVAVDEPRMAWFQRAPVS